MKAPFPYFGGKSRVASLVWQRFGDTKNYVEPFAGSLAVLLAREEWQGSIETVNDADCYLSNFWRATQSDAESVAHFADWPVNECDLHARHNWLVNSDSARVFRERMKSDPEYFDSKIAGWWVWGISQWIGSGWCVHPEWRGRTNAGAAARGIHALPHKMPILGNGGIGVNSATQTLSNQIPHLSHAGTGVAARINLYEYFDALQNRLRRVRVCCGDWARITGPAVTTCVGMTAVFLDPPYSHAVRDTSIYSVESDISADVQKWALENGNNSKLRIALCGYEGEHEMPDSWECVAWKANGGYGAKGGGRGADNAHRERIWFSPHCLKPRNQLSLMENQ